MEDFCGFCTQTDGENGFFLGISAVPTVWKIGGFFWGALGRAALEKLGGA